MNLKVDKKSNKLVMVENILKNLNLNKLATIYSENQR